MADRGRDLKISVLSDADKFDLAKPAQEMDDLGRAVKDAANDLENYGRDTERVARRVDDAFDAISRSSRTNLRGKLDDDVNHAKRKMGEFNEEARQSAREAAASFSGTATDVQDLGQEILANAPVAFGPAGLAIGGALAAGFGLLYSKWTETKEKIKAQAGEIAGALIDANGALDEAFIQSKLRQFVEDGTITQLAQQATDAQIPVRDFIRAVAGDPEALERVNAALGESRSKFAENAAGSINAADALSVFDQKQDVVRDKLGITTEATKTGTTAFQLYKLAAEKPVVPKFNGSQAAADADNLRTRLEAAARTPVTFVATMDTSPAYQKFRQMERDFTNSTVRARP